MLVVGCSVAEETAAVLVPRAGRSSDQATAPTSATTTKIPLSSSQGGEGRR